MRDSPVEFARRLAAGEADAQALAWLREGFARYARNDVPLEVALRLDRASRIRQRDAALLRAAQALGDQASTWATAIAMEGAVRRFRDRVLPFLADCRELGELDAALRDAFAAGERVPASRRQLWALLC